MPPEYDDTAPESGFWGTDGFNADDLGSLLEMGVDTASGIAGIFNPGASVSGAPVMVQAPAQNNTPLYLIGGAIVLLLAVGLFLIARR